MEKLQCRGARAVLGRREREKKKKKRKKDRGILSAKGKTPLLNELSCSFDRGDEAALGVAR